MRDVPGSNPGLLISVLVLSTPKKRRSARRPSIRHRGLFSEVGNPFPVNTLDLLYATVGTATAPFWARKTRGGWPERFGHAPALPAKQRPRLLLHAVSVGEVNALRTLVPLLTPTLDVVVSATTDTGLARARELYAGAATVVRYPLDFSRSVRRFLDAIKPDAVVLVELELWPNFIAQCRQRGIPMGVVNGRLSERSFRGYSKIRPFMRGSFASLRFAAVQDSDYAARFEFMGVPADRCLVTGSMKWDAAPSSPEGVGENAQRLASLLGIDRRVPLIVAGSTGPGEEALLHAACPPGVQLLCAPRKPERFDEAAHAMPGCVRRSKCKAGGPPGGPGNFRFLLDSIGELRDAYSLADLVVVGRSFGDQFGSDPVEPAALGRPTLIGPAFGDFVQSVNILRGAGGIVVSSRGELAGDLGCSPTERRERIAGPGFRPSATTGASLRHAELLKALLSGPRQSKAERAVDLR